VQGQEVFCDGRYTPPHVNREVRFDHALGGYWGRTRLHE
jgi:hypothetical protein